MLLLALPGHHSTAAQTSYRLMLQAALGSPLQVSGWLVVAYFLHLWRRRVSGAEGGLIATLTILSWAGPSTVNLATLAPLQLVPATAVLLLLAARGVWLGSSFRLMLLAGYFLLDASILSHGMLFTAANGFLPWHLFMAAFLCLGLAYRDDFAKWIADVSPPLLILGAAVAMLANRYVFMGTTPAINALAMLGFATIAAFYWRRQRSTIRLAALAACLTSSAGLATEQLLLHSNALMLMKGKRWLALGVVCFGAGLLISLVKGGQVQRLIAWLKSFDEREENEERSG